MLEHPSNITPEIFKHIIILKDPKWGGGFMSIDIHFVNYDFFIPKVLILY